MIPNSVRVSTHPCFTPFLIGNRSDAEPSCWTVPFMSSWKNVMIFNSVIGHPILCSIMKRPFLFTRSKALVKSTKAMKNAAEITLI